MLTVYMDKDYIDLIMGDIQPTTDQILCYPGEEVVAIVKYDSRNYDSAKRLTDKLDAHIIRFVVNRDARGGTVYAVLVKDKEEK